MSTPAGKRRTQAERRTETEAKLVDATIESILEKGYARTTVKEISQRAGVSHGALFGRFGTLFDLMLAAAAEVGRRQIDHFTAALAQLADPHDLDAVLDLLQASARRPINMVWTELMVAARTDPELRDRLAAVHEEYVIAIASNSTQASILQDAPPGIALAVLKIVLNYFDGDALIAVPYPSPGLDPFMRQVLAAMLQSYAATVSAADTGRPRG